MAGGGGGAGRREAPSATGKDEHGQLFEGGSGIQVAILNTL